MTYFRESGDNTISKIYSESVNQLDEWSLKSLKILCFWQYIPKKRFYLLMKKYLEIYSLKTRMVTSFLTSFHHKGSQIQVYVKDSVV